MYRLTSKEEVARIKQLASPEPEELQYLRLAAYEDLGKEPEELARLFWLLDELVLYAGIAERQEKIDKCTSAVEKEQLIRPYLLAIQSKEQDLESIRSLLRKVEEAQAKDSRPLLKKVERAADLDMQYIFVCRKCEHNLYCEKGKISLLLDMDCPNCGEEGHENWTLSRAGCFEKDFPEEHD